MTDGQTDEWTDFQLYIYRLPFYMMVVGSTVESSPTSSPTWQWRKSWGSKENKGTAAAVGKKARFQMKLR